MLLVEVQRVCTENGGKHQGLASGFDGGGDASSVASCMLGDGLGLLFEKGRVNLRE
jgi:hypothetical protein